MRIHSAKRFTALTGLLVTLLLPKTARADFPTGTLTASRENFHVRLDLSWYYHGSLMPDCRVRIERKPNIAGGGIVVFSGDLGEESFECECRKWFTWEPGMEDAVGRSCSPGNGVWDVQGDCPEGHSCNCARTCKPFYDTPCNGPHTYYAEALDFAHPSGYGGAARADIDVDWVGPLCLDGPGAGTGEAGTGEDGGCTAAGTRPHLIMCLILALAALVPIWLRRRKRNS